jgi:hypothetical protein
VSTKLQKCGIIYVELQTENLKGKELHAKCPNHYSKFSLTLWKQMYALLEAEYEERLHGKCYAEGKVVSLIKKQLETSEEKS